MATNSENEKKRILNLLGRNFRKPEFVDEDPVLVGGDAVGSGLSVRSVGGFGGFIQIRRVVVL